MPALSNTGMCIQKNCFEPGKSTSSHKLNKQHTGGSALRDCQGRRRDLLHTRPDEAACMNLWQNFANIQAEESGNMGAALVTVSVAHPWLQHLVAGLLGLRA